MRTLHPTWHDGFLALVALGGVLIGVAFGAEELLVFGGEGLVHKGALTLEALKTVFMPMTVFVGQILQENQLFRWRHKNLYV